MKVTTLTFKPVSGGFKCNQNGIFVKRKPRKTYAFKCAKEEVNNRNQEMERKNADLYPRKSASRLLDEDYFRKKYGWAL